MSLEGRDAEKRFQDLIAGVRLAGSTYADARSGLDEGIRALMAGRRANPLQSGFPIDDRLVDFLPGLVTLLAADSGVGKSTIATQFAYHAAAMGHGVIYLNLEMDSAMYAIRTMTNFAGVPCRLNLTETEFKSVCAAGEKLAVPSTRILMGNRKYHRTPAAILKFCQGARDQLAHKGAPLALIVVDHVLEITVSAKGDKDAEGKARSDLLKELAQSCGAHVLALAHITRAASKLGSVPTKNDLAGSAWFDRAADTTMIFHQARNPNGTFASKPAILSVQKSRWDGPFAVELTYQSGFFAPWSLT